jgi:hypothetical protein
VFKIQQSNDDPFLYVYAWHHDTDLPVLLGSTELQFLEDLGKAHKVDQKVALDNGSGDLLLQLNYKPDKVLKSADTKANKQIKGNSCLSIFAFEKTNPSPDLETAIFNFRCKRK